MSLNRQNISMQSQHHNGTYLIPTSTQTSRKKAKATTTCTALKAKKLQTTELVMPHTEAELTACQCPISYWQSSRVQQMHSLGHTMMK